MILTSTKQSFRKTALAIAMIATLGAMSSPPALALELPDFATLVKENRAAVVNITTTKSQKRTSFSAPDQAFPEQLPEQFRRFFEQMPRNGEQAPRQMRGQGSGFVMNESGYILTNAHVVDGADEIRVSLSDRRELVATLIGADAQSDVAVLKVDATDLPAVKLGKSGGLEVGDWVLAIGSPFGFSHSASQGIVSALSRSLPDGTYVPFIQTDVAVNPGNSGGPLFDTEGNVVGINSQIYSRSGGYMGVSFAIPIDLAMNVANQLLDTGEVARGWLGVSIQDLNQDLAQSFGLDRPEGALVAEVSANSPAEQAGLMAGDVILSFGDTKLKSSAALPPLVGTTIAGETVNLEVRRDGKNIELPVKIGALESENRVAMKEAAAQKGALGVMVGSAPDGGVQVSTVQPDSPAFKSGIRQGDVILSFNNKEVNEPADLQNHVASAPKDKPLAVLLMRDGRTRYLSVTLSDVVG